MRKSNIQILKLKNYIYFDKVNFDIKFKLFYILTNTLHRLQAVEITNSKLL